MELNSIKTATMNGQAYEIPESVRKDGSIRKARRVKPGFVPQEEVPKYRNPMERKQQPSSAFPPGWHPTPAAPAKTQKKEKKDGAQNSQNLSQPSQQAPSLDRIRIRVKNEIAKPAAPQKTEKKIEEISEKLQDKLQISADPIELKTIELSKKLKRVRKKLREIDTLEEKMKGGEVQAPEKDQLEKIARKKKLEDEITQLEKEREKLRKLKPKSV